MAQGVIAKKRLTNMLGVGWAMPFHFDEVTGGVARQTSLTEQDEIELINNSLETILNTHIGERVIRRRFGSLLYSLVDEPINQLLSHQITQYVIGAIDRYERRIDIIETNINFDKRDNGIVEILIRYKIIKTQKEGNMVYPFYTSLDI